MSGDGKTESRKALKPSDMEGAGDGTVDTDKVKDILTHKQAPATIDKRFSSEQPRPPESNDVQYLSWAEKVAGGQFNTLDVVVVPDHDANPESHSGPWIDFCSGYNQKTHNHIVQKLPGKFVKVSPEFVVRYRGNVVQDHLSVHTSVVRHRKIATGYCFDRFFEDGKRRLDRCCLVMDRVHQAGLIYEKFVPKGSTVAMVRMKPLKDTPNKPMYVIVKADEGTYRDLKRLFTRHFMRQNDGIMDNDLALAGALNEMLPEIPTET